MTHCMELGWLIGLRCDDSLLEAGQAHCLEMWWLIAWSWAGSLFEDVMTHWLELGWLISRRCDDSLVGAGLDHLLKMWQLIAWSWAGSLFEDVMAHCSKMQWLIAWSWVGSLVVDVMTHWFGLGFAPSQFHGRISWWSAWFTIPNCWKKNSGYLLRLRSNCWAGLICIKNWKLKKIQFVVKSFHQKNN